MRGLIYSSLAAAVIMAMSGTASAEYRGDKDETGATLTKKVKAEVDVKYEGKVMVGGFVNVNKLGMAVVDNQQSSTMIGTANSRTENASKIDGSFQGASGNIGANVAAGDSNVQGNSVSLAAYDQVDAEFVMGGGHPHGSTGGSSDAEIFSSQSASMNWASNQGHQNRAVSVVAPSRMPRAISTPTWPPAPVTCRPTTWPPRYPPAPWRWPPWPTASMCPRT